MNKFLVGEGLVDSHGHVCIRKVVQLADMEADFFWEQLFDCSDDEEELADAVEMLIKLYLQGKTKVLYWIFAVLKAEGMALPPHILTGAAFTVPEFTAFYFGTFLFRIAWKLQETMEVLDMEDFFYQRLME